jgi:hypothetical protein
MKPKSFCFLAIMFICLCLTAVQAKEIELSDSMPLKNSTRAFTHKFLFRLINGKIWVKSALPSDGNAEWELLNGHGLPAKKKGSAPYSISGRLIGISADGDNLIAVDNHNIVYYTKTYNWEWKDHFSAIPFTSQLKLPAKRRAWGISHRGSYMKYYNDIDGNPHSVSAGVTTLYLLGEKGDMIYYADPWLPPRFAHIIDTPARGTFIAENMRSAAQRFS